jgi:hypothetical protein
VSHGTDWMRDVAVGTDVLVATDVRLVRAAELAASNSYDAAMIVAVEKRLIDGVTSGSVAESLADRWPASDIDTYLADAVEPSDAAVHRFVAYATRKNVLGDRVCVIDTSSLNEAAIQAFAARSVHASIYLAGSDGRARTLAVTSCRDVLEALEG